jgi:hypothetical protein
LFGLVAKIGILSEIGKSLRKNRDFPSISCFFFVTFVPVKEDKNKKMNMRMKKSVLVSLLLACLPLFVMAQSNDDLYFIPKKKTEKKVTSGTPAKVVIEKDKAPTTVYAEPGSTVVVKDVKGNVRDVDEYNRRYTSRDNTFSMENDTLYIEEKPYNERGEWVNGFEGSQSDYEYAMRIIRFRNPRYAIPLSSPLYWDVVYTLPSWEWNVFDDGYYAYAFPTYSNRLWWDWRFNYSWGWRSSWYYNSWYGPGYWYGGYWGGWPHYHHHHHHYHPHYAWGGVGGYWGGGHGWNGSSARNPGIHAGRYNHNYATTGASSRRVVTTGNRNSRDNYVNGVRQNTRNEGSVRTSGRVVTAKDGSSSVRPQRSAVRGRENNSTYTRPTQGRSSSYNRQSSTRSTVNNTGSSSSYQRKSGAAERGAYRSNSSSRNSENRSSYNSSRSSSSSRSSYSSGSSSSRSSYSSGSSSSSSRSSGGGGSRSGGGRR